MPRALQWPDWLSAVGIPEMWLLNPGHSDGWDIVGRTDSVDLDRIARAKTGLHAGRGPAGRAVDSAT